MNKPVTERITAAEAAAHLPDMLERVRLEGVVFEITSGDEVVARVVPLEGKKALTSEEFDRAIKSWPRLGAEEAKLWEEEVAAIRRELPLPPNPWE